MSGSDEARTTALRELAVAVAASCLPPGVRLDVLDLDGRTLVGPDGAVTGLGEGLVGSAATHVAVRDDPVTGLVAVPVRADGVGLVAVLSATLARADAAEQAARVAPALALGRRWLREVGRVTAAERHAERAVQTQEAERARLAREIHDGVSQRLAGVGFHLSAAASLVGADDEGARAQLAAARELVALAGSETRAAIGDLRPPVLDDLGLAAALASLARGFAARPDAPETVVDTDEWGETDPAADVPHGSDGGTVLPEQVSTALYRIAQEALGNAVRHAGALLVEVGLHRASTAAGECVVLTVTDDGCGFAVDGGRAVDGRDEAFGLRSMRERADLVGARFTVVSAPGRGTTVRVVVPLPGRNA